MGKSSLSFFRRRRRVITLMAAIIALGLTTPAVAAQRRSIPVMIQTVPELPGARFALEGQTFTADENGLALAVVEEPGTYSLRVLSREMERGERAVARFSIWSDGKIRTDRIVHVESFTYLQAGFQIEQAVSFEFVTANGAAVDSSDIEGIGLVGPKGEQKRLSGPGPHRLIATSADRKGSDITLEESRYRIEEVILDGRDVLPQGVLVDPSQGEAQIELAVSNRQAAAGPEEESEGLPDLSSEWLLVIAAVAGAGALTFLLAQVATKVHPVAATRAGLQRAKAWSPGAHLRRLNPLPAVATGMRRINPAPKIASEMKKRQEARRAKPKPAAVPKKEKRRPRAEKPPKVEKKWTLGARPRVEKPPKPEKKKTPRGARPRAEKPPKPEKKKTPRSARPKAEKPPKVEKKKSQPSGRGVNPMRGLSAGIRKRRLRAQLNSLGQSGPGSKVRKRQVRKGMPEPKSSGRVALLWLRGSGSRPTMRAMERGPKVRIKLRNGHLVTGTIRRTPSHVDQDALNIVVERVFDQFGHEVPNSPQDSFILPSQIVRIEKFEEKDRVIRLPEPEERVAEPDPSGHSGTK